MRRAPFSILRNSPAVYSWISATSSLIGLGKATVFSSPFSSASVTMMALDNRSCCSWGRWGDCLASALASTVGKSAGGVAFVQPVPNIAPVVSLDLVRKYGVAHLGAGLAVGRCGSVLSVFARIVGIAGRDCQFPFGPRPRKFAAGLGAGRVGDRDPAGRKSGRYHGQQVGDPFHVDDGLCGGHVAGSKPRIDRALGRVRLAFLDLAGGLEWDSFNSQEHHGGGGRIVDRRAAVQPDTTVAVPPDQFAAALPDAFRRYRRLGLGVHGQQVFLLGPRR